MWSARKFDKSASQETTATYGSKDGSARVNKLLIPKEALAAVTKAGSALRTEYLKLTLPWSDNNQRLLSGVHYLKFTERMRELVKVFDNAADALCREYAVLVAEAEVALNGLYNAADYPAQDEVRDKFSSDLTYLPVPQSGHLLVDIGNEETAKLKEKIDSAVNDSLERAQGDAWQRLFDVVKHMAERLDDTEAVFRDTLVGNIKSLVDLLPGLNVTGDAKLAQLQRDVEDKLLVYTPKELRKDDFARADTAKAAKDIMTSMAAYMG